MVREDDQDKVADTVMDEGMARWPKQSQHNQMRGWTATVTAGAHNGWRA